MSAQPIMPVYRGEDGWYIDASELTPDCPAYGPYDKKWEAEEDRRPSFIRRIRAKRRLGLDKAPDDPTQLEYIGLDE